LFAVSHAAGQSPSTVSGEPSIVVSHIGGGASQLVSSTWALLSPASPPPDFSHVSDSVLHAGLGTHAALASPGGEGERPDEFDLDGVAGPEDGEVCIGHEPERIGILIWSAFLANDRSCPADWRPPSGRTDENASARLLRGFR
jgi:hypothetical protein